MLIALPEVKTAPAMPTWLGRRISPTDAPLADPGQQLVGLLVVEEERGAVGFEHARRLAHHLEQHGAELDVGGDVGDQIEKTISCWRWAFTRSLNCRLRRVAVV